MVASGLAAGALLPERKDLVDRLQVGLKREWAVGL